MFYSVWAINMYSHLTRDPADPSHASEKTPMHPTAADTKLSTKQIDCVYQ